MIGIRIPPIWTRAPATAGPGRGHAERFVMATDLGLLVKLAADGSRDVYVMALGAGQPVADVEIRALALNGSILQTTRTDADGHARLEQFVNNTGERKAVAIIAAKDDDISFLPLGERQLPAMDYSRFDIDGVVASRIKSVEAFVFTERGVYRPGDTIHAGCIVRRRDWQPVLEGLPLVHHDQRPAWPRGRQPQTRLPYDGLFSCDLALSEAAALGVHRISVDVLNRKATPCSASAAPPCGWRNSNRTG